MNKGQTAAKRRNKRKKKKRDNVNLRRKQIKDKIEALEDQTKLSKAEEQYEQEIIDRKYRKFKKTCISLLYKIGFGAFVVILIIAVISLITLIVFYLQSDITNCPLLEKYEELKDCPILQNRTVTTKAFNIVQLLSGIISVVVGVWALVLTYKSRQKSDEHNLYIREIIVDAESLKGYKENDLNPKSLG